MKKVSFFSKTLALVLALVCVATICPTLTAGAAAYIKYGDVNQDGAVNLIDELSVLNHVAASTPLTGEALALADADESGTVDIADVTMIAGSLRGLGSCVLSNHHAITDCPSYDLNKYMQPYWSSNIIYNESVLPFKNQDGSMSPIQLLYNIESIVSVRNSKLDILYTEGVDYTVENGKLVILTTGSIPIQSYSFLFPSSSSSNTQPDKKHGYMYFSEGPTFHNMQIAVTYVKRDSSSWGSSIPQKKGALLPKTMAKLSSGQSLNVVLYGDSISYGCNVSSLDSMNVAPFTPKYYEMLTAALYNEYGSNISVTNTSVGGMDSAWGANNAQANVAVYNPDLVIIAFGMNDGCPQSTFVSRIQTIMNTAKAANSNCEFVLVASMRPNPNWGALDQTSYLAGLKTLEDTGVAVADMTTPHGYIMSRKNYEDITGNHVNHPNDFIVRMYAQVLYNIFQY